MFQNNLQLKSQDDCLLWESQLLCHSFHYNQKLQSSFHSPYQGRDNLQVDFGENQKTIQANVQAHFLDQIDTHSHRFDQIPHVWVHHNQHFLNRQMSHLKWKQEYVVIIYFFCPKGWAGALLELPLLGVTIYNWCQDLS